MLFMSYDTESKSRNADFKNCGEAATTTLGPQGPVKLKNPPAAGRSILRTFPLNPLNPHAVGVSNGAARIGGGERSELIRRMLIMSYDTESKSRNVLASPLGEEGHEVAKGVQANWIHRGEKRPANPVRRHPAKSV